MVIDKNAQNSIIQSKIHSNNLELQNNMGTINGGPSVSNSHNGKLNLNQPNGSPPNLAPPSAQSRFSSIVGAAKPEYHNENRNHEYSNALIGRSKGGNGSGYAVRPVWWG